MENASFSSCAFTTTSSPMFFHFLGGTSLCTDTTTSFSGFVVCRKTKGKNSLIRCYLVHGGDLMASFSSSQVSNCKAVQFCEWSCYDENRPYSRWLINLKISSALIKVCRILNNRQLHNDVFYINVLLVIQPTRNVSTCEIRNHFLLNKRKFIKLLVKYLLNRDILITHYVSCTNT